MLNLEFTLGSIYVFTLIVCCGILRTGELDWDGRAL